ncbi:hypothetical protein AAFA46_08405 [Oscillospiraceae bacterium WX1]
MKIIRNMALDPERAQHIGGLYQITITFDEESNEELESAFLDALNVFRNSQPATSMSGHSQSTLQSVST